MSFVRLRLPVLCEWFLLIFLALSILVRGGKGLEFTWLLAGVAVAITFFRWWSATRNKTDSSSADLFVWSALMLFVLWTVLSYLFTTTGNYGLDEVIREASLALVFVWGVWTMRHSSTSGSDFVSRCMMVISVAALLACAAGVAVYVLQPVNRFVGTFFDWRFHTDYWPNAWAEFLLLAWPVMLLWVWNRKWWVQAPALGLVIGCLFLSYSRGAFLVFCGQMILWAGFLLFHGVSKKKILRAGITVISTLMIAAAVFVACNALRGRLYEVESVTAKATFTASEGASSVSERRDFWMQSLVLSAQKPLFGWGPYSFRFVQPRLQTHVFATSDHAHNVFLKLAMERGWPAALLFGFILLSILGQAFLREVRKPTARLALLVALAGVLAHNLIDYNLQFVGIVLAFTLLLSILAPTATPSVNIKRVMRAIEILVAVALACITILEGRMLVLSSFGRHAEERGDIPEALAWYERADGELFSRDMSLSRGAMLLQRGDLVGAANVFVRSAEQNGEDARIWILLGNLASMNNDADVALDRYSRAMTLGAYNYLEPMEGMLRILETGAHPEITAARKEEFMTVFHAFGEAILRNAHFIALSETVETFDRVSELLQKLYPADRTGLRTFTDGVLQHADSERTRLATRKQGLLW